MSHSYEIYTIFWNILIYPGNCLSRFQPCLAWNALKIRPSLSRSWGRSSTNTHSRWTAVTAARGKPSAQSARAGFSYRASQPARQSSVVGLIKTSVNVLTGQNKCRPTLKLWKCSVGWVAGRPGVTVKKIRKKGMMIQLMSAWSNLKPAFQIVCFSSYLLGLKKREPYLVEAFNAWE